MKAFLNKQAKHFEKGGKLERWFPVFEMVDTFIYTPLAKTTGRTHARDGIELKRIMTTVVLALIPCVLMAFYNTGLQANNAIVQTGTIPEGLRYSILAYFGAGFNPGSIYDNAMLGLSYFLPLYIATLVVGGIWEVLFAVVRKHEIGEAFLVTSLLYPLILPPTVPVWQAMVALSIGLVFGKELFGGTGRNLVNPALFARAVLFFSYPASASGDTVWIALDGFSRATPLAAQASGLEMNVTFFDAFIGFIPGSMGETSTLACLIGAFILIVTGIGSWRIMLSSVIGLVAVSGLFFAIGSDTNPMFSLSPQWHLVVGGFAFATVFMATDPVSASFTEKGKYYYGFLIGALTALVRVVNPAYPEGAMLAVLFANVMAPLVDYVVIRANIKRRGARSAA
ncbi:NADH:ubiquinone oxidoreductase, subunit B [Denitrovibrio acetiphilus DSM 12809]|uniref:Na(+)-translocating NADH-quinone reductase subunit B n=1 Tax=Denitrovibrio acetiphilus (strain DSM 12809 / NBRC 114555 / N2460) TaxID=522772 RepID=D4H1M4_DENA2|nr:NADH:ubiquinone reductase (Na(+)-transporting) subunit B [Denitrovibrio acetiphilus]ADD68784.1 NADH:ubiquinone oxidoreductase, subunit B [Denitrovibrio acetiphilus DSM 12809]